MRRLTALLLAAAAADDGGGLLPPTEAARTIVDVTGETEVDDSVLLVDHAGELLTAQPRLDPVQLRCQQAVRRALAESAAPASRTTVYPDPLHGITVEPKPHEDDVRIVYFVLASREGAAETVSRLLRALYHPSHLYLVHVDLKANASVHDDLVAQAEGRPNVHVLKTRRLTQWGGFSMVAALLDAVASFAHRLHFDFLINLSDADLPLRTNEEVSAFLRRFKGRAFMRVDAEETAHTGRVGGQAAPPRPRRHAFELGELAPRAVIECGGFGFVSVNSTPAPLSVGPPCCLGPSGPIVHAQLPYEPPRPRPAGASEYRGSQWSILPAAFCRHLLSDEAALQWARVFERRLLPDELFLPTVLMHSPFRHTLINHNLRHEVWPPTEAAQRAAYYDALPLHAWGGPTLLNASSLLEAMRGPMLFARRAHPAHDRSLLPMYDPWMRRKLRGEHCLEQPPIAAPLLRADPDLYGLAAPPFRPAVRPAGDGAAAGEAADGEAAARLTPRRISRRRRVATLLFADGSSCSCAPNCRPVASGGADAPALSAPADAGQAALPCCAHLADGRAALCAAPGGEDELSAMAADAASSAGDGWTAAGEPRLPPCPAPTEPPSSRDGGEAVTALFINRAPYPTRVYHVEAEALEVPVLSLRPGEHAEVAALTSHAWRVRKHGGALLLELPTTPPALGDAPDAVSTVHILECAEA